MDSSWIFITGFIHRASCRNTRTSEMGVRLKGKLKHIQRQARANVALGRYKAPAQSVCAENHPEPQCESLGVCRAPVYICINFYYSCRLRCCPGAYFKYIPEYFLVLSEGKSPIPQWGSMLMVPTDIFATSRVIKPLFQLNRIIFKPFCSF